MGDLEYGYAQKVLLTLLNIVTAIVGQAIFVSPLSDSTNTDAISSIFGISLFLYLVVSIGVILSTTINKEKFKTLKEQKRLLIVILGHIVTTVAGLAYLIGDNITPIFATYQSELNCDAQCLEAVGNAGTTLLIASLLLFGIAPIFLSGAVTVSDLVYNISETSEPSWSLWKVMGHSIALIVELDAWFSTISDLPTKSDSFCAPHDVQILWVMYCLTIFLWAVVLAVLFAPGIIKAMAGSQHKLRDAVILAGIAVIIWFSSAIALVAENDQPIGCLFECDFTAGNRTDTCNENAQHGTRIGLLFLAAIPITIISFFLVFHWFKKIQKLYIPAPEDNEVKNVELKSITVVEEKS